MKYTDDTPILFGKYKFTRLSRVPAEYLLTLLKNKCPDKDIITYIEQNIESIKARLNIEVPPLELPCDKVIYVNEKEAKLHLSNIRSKEQDHKKPIRAYECEKCGGWHLTSQEKRA
jgi:uncharacterized protein (DUF3820 family)